MAKTQKEMFEYIAEQMGNDPEVVEFCEKKIEQLSKKRPSKPRVNTMAHMFAVQIGDLLREAGEPMTNAEITAAYNEQYGEEVNGQKVSAALRKLVDGAVIVFANESDKEGTPYTLTVERIEPETKSGKATFVAE